MTEKAEKSIGPRYRAVAKLNFPSYEQARREFDAWTRVPRKRIRKRPDGTFDVIEFVKLEPESVKKEG